MNKVILIGRLTKDPELKITASGIDMCSFGIAVNRPANANGEKEADFINCVAFKINAANLGKYKRKGDLICVEGTLQTRKYQAQDGSNRVATEVVVNYIEFLDSAKREEQPQANAYQQAPYNANAQPQPAQAAAYNPFGTQPARATDPFANVRNQFEITDEDLPF